MPRLSGPHTRASPVNTMTVGATGGAVNIHVPPGATPEFWSMHSFKAWQHTTVFADQPCLPKRHLAMCKVLGPSFATHKAKLDGSWWIASLAALDACGTNEAQVELLVELRTLAEAERALQTAMPLACKGFNMNPEFETSSVFGTENSLLPLPSYNQESESLAAFEGKDQTMMQRLRRAIRELTALEASRVVEKLTRFQQPSLMVCSPVDPAADAVDFEVDRLSETLLFAVGLSGSGGGSGKDLWDALVAGCQGAQAEAAEATAQAAQAGDEAGTSQGLPLDGLWLEAMYNVGAIALELRREEIQLYADAWCTRAIELDWQLQLEEIDETLGWVFQQVEHLKAKAQQVLILRRLEGSVESAMTVRPSFPPPSVLSLRWAMLKKPARDGVRDLQMLRKRPTGPSKVKQTVPPEALIDAESGRQLNAIMRQMGSDEPLGPKRRDRRDGIGYPTNVAADLKTGVKKVQHRHVGEAKPMEADGSCSHHLLVRDGNSSDCILPQRIDVGKHFIMTGGPEAIREPYEDMISRVSSFGRYLFNLQDLPVVEKLFEDEKFQHFAKSVCPKEKQVLDPFQFNFILSVPGQTVALHLDAPYFLGATRFQVPQWLLAVMVFSGLFQERFVDQVQVVGYLHDQMAVEDQSAGGLFLYYDENSATPKSFPSSPLSGISVDGSKTLHAAGVFKPEVKTPFLDKDKDNALFYVGDELWELRSEGQVLQSYNSSELRMTIVYRARCFTSEEERQRYLKQAPEDLLSLDEILEKLKEDLVKRRRLSRDQAASMDRLDLAVMLLDTYIKYPLPDLQHAKVPLNYCALPRRAGQFRHLLTRLLNPAKPPPGLLSFQQWLQGPAGHAVLARYRAS
ncbi:unnamed protein product [Durusdinium trenchii]|uniref:Uncharacterized protein n=1 Tax=Durusdinium trenchii TaxID=1381693 RepID=A0ABP0QP71_9DINO